MRDRRRIAKIHSHAGHSKRSDCGRGKPEWLRMSNQQRCTWQATAPSLDLGLSNYNIDEFKSALKSLCGDSARDYEVTDGTNIVCFFPSLSSDVIAASLRRELQNPDALPSGYIDSANRRIDALKSLRPYAGAKSPFIEGRLSAEWKKPNA